MPLGRNRQWCQKNKKIHLIPLLCTQMNLLFMTLDGVKNNVRTKIVGQQSWKWEYLLYMPSYSTFFVKIFIFRYHSKRFRS